MNERVFVVDDHEASAEALVEALEDVGYEARGFNEAAEALVAVHERPPATLITDLRMDGMDGMALLREVQRREPALPVIMVTAYATIERAIEATQAGAFAFVTKPIKLPELLVQVRNAVAMRKLQAAVGEPGPGEEILGRSALLLQALTRADRAAATRMTVLITGESGTGKELVARRIHRRSDRRDNSFVAVNCGAIPDSLLEAELFGAAKGAYTGATDHRIGLVESAHLGTLFLDEVGELSPAAQTGLLRVLQEGVIRRVGEVRDRKVDVRVIAATHRDLKGDGFRDDLFYRLNVIPVELPPLRARGDDVLLLFGQALHKVCKELGREVPHPVSDTVDALRSYRWPGNVRELINLADRLAVLCTADHITLEDLPPEIAQSAQTPDLVRVPEGDFDLTGWLEGLEELALRKALKKHDGVKAQAAASLGLERNAFRYKLKKYDIEQ